MQLPLQARRPGTWWDAPVLIRRVTTPPSRAVRGKIYNPPRDFGVPPITRAVSAGASSAGPSSVSLEPLGLSGRLPRRAHGRAHWIRCCILEEGSSWHLPQGKFQRRGYPRQTDARQ